MHDDSALASVHRRARPVPTLGERLARGPALLAVLLALSGCPLGLGSDDTVQDGKLYIGYFAESTTNNPEDPVFTPIVLSVPPGNGDFKGQFPFSFTGCAPGIDTGKVTGKRGFFSALEGTWSGNFDQTNLTGKVSAFYSGSAQDSFEGTWSTDGGKVTVQSGSCSYAVAASGNFRAWGTTTNSPSIFTLTIGAGTVPDFTWLSLGEIRYTLGVFDYQCLVATPSNVDCLMALQSGLTGSSVSYETFSGAKPLDPGKEYLAVILGYDGATRYQGRASKRFTP